MTMPMRLKCCGGRMRSRHDGNSTCSIVLAAYHTAQPSCSALHLAASKRVAHHSPQPSCTLFPPEPDQIDGMARRRWLNTRNVSDSTASRFPRIPAGKPGVGWITLRLPVMLSFGSTGLPCCSLGVPHYNNSLRPLVVVVGAADQIGDEQHQQNQKHRVGRENQKRAHEIPRATTNAATKGNTAHQKNISIHVITISCRFSPGQS